MKENRKKRAIIAGMAVTVICIVVFALLAGRNSTAKKITELLDLGNKYLTEQDYEEAVVAFQEAIAIDPKCEEAYRGLADVYVAMGDYESAIDILQQGMEQTGAEKLAAYLEEIKETYARIQEEAAAREREEAEAVAEAERAREQDELLSRVAIRIINRYLNSYDVYEMNAKGNGIRHTYYYDDQGGSTQIVYEFEDGYWLKTTRYDNGAVTWEERAECEYEYDADGKILTASYYEDGWLGRVEEYDSDGRVEKRILSEETEYRIDTYETYEYDVDGNEIKITTVDKYDDGETFYTETIKEYDSKGRLVRSATYNEGELLDEVTYSWEYKNDSGESQTIYLQEYERLYDMENLGGKLVRETFYGESDEILMENLY